MKANFIFLCGRHQQDHDCPKLVLPQKSMTATKAVVDEILSSAPAPPKTEKKVRSVKAQKTAAKVQLMKLKMKSSGDKERRPTKKVLNGLICREMQRKSFSFFCDPPTRQTWQIYL